MRMVSDVPIPRLKAVCLIAAIFAVSSIPAASDDAPVWFWFATCGGPVMALEVGLDAKNLYKGSFAICQASRSSQHSQGQQSRLEFSFRPERPVVWRGYRDKEDRTGLNHRLTCQLWQAGADPDAVVIGVTFADEQKIYMNTVHIARPGKRNETEVADGLVVLTYPAEHANAGKQ